VQTASSPYDRGAESSFSPYVRKQHGDIGDDADFHGYGDGANSAGNSNSFAGGHNNNNNYSLNNSFANLNLNVHAESKGTPTNSKQLGGSDIGANLYGNGANAAYESGEVSAPVSYGAGEFTRIPTLQIHIHIKTYKNIYAQIHTYTHI
jgi:hypothetical protein